MSHTTEQFATRLQDLSEAYDVELTFTTRLYGGTPADEDLIRGWIKASMGLEGADLERMVAETLANISTPEEPDPVLDEETAEPIIEHQEKGVSEVFKHNEDGHLIIEARQLKSALREAQKRLKLSSNRASDVKNAVWITPHTIEILHDGEPITEPDGYETRAKQLRMGGSALGRHAFVEGAVLRFRLHRARGIAVTWDMLQDMLALCQVAGFGAMHNHGEGQFVVTKWEEAE